METNKWAFILLPFAILVVAIGKVFVRNAAAQNNDSTTLQDATTRRKI